MQKPKYKFTIDDIQVYPHYKELTKKLAPESGQKFFRTTLEGKLTLYGSDFLYVFESGIETEHVFKIFRIDAVGNESLYFTGYFNKTDCKFDKDRRECELKLSSKDQYTELLNNYDKTYDLVKLKTALSRLNITKRPLVQVYIRGSNTISNFIGGTYWESDVSTSVDDDDQLKNKYYFSYIRTLNEIYIENAGVKEVNGVYAGSNLILNGWNGYHVKSEELPGGSGIKRFYIIVTRDSDNAVIYRSKQAYSYLNDDDDKYIGRDDIEFINTTNENDKFVMRRHFLYPIYQRLLCDKDSITVGETTKQTYRIPSDDFVGDVSNYRYCIGLVSNDFFCSSRTVDEPTKYGINDYNKYFTNQIMSAITGITHLLPVCRSTWANASVWFSYSLNYDQFEEAGRKQYQTKDNYSIAAVIKSLLTKVAPNIKHEATQEYSQFLYGTSNPITSSRFKVFITQKTNILKGEYDQPAQKAEITFEEVMNMLRDCFRCYFYIDGDKLKIEHIYWFMQGGSYSLTNNVQIDLPNLIYTKNGKELSFFTNKFEYDKTELASRYEYAWMDDVTEAFKGTNIDVVSNYIQKDKTENININKFTSDIDYMLLSPQSFSNDGFALLGAIETNQANTWTVPFLKINMVDEFNDQYTLNMQNGYMSWFYLVKFYMYDMPAVNIKYTDLQYLHVSDVKRCMKQEVKFPYPTDPDTVKLIVTDKGYGQVDELSINLNTLQVTATLVYKPS